MKILAFFQRILVISMKPMMGMVGGGQGVLHRRTIWRWEKEERMGTNVSNVVDKRKQNEISATPVRGNNTTGGEVPPNEAAESKKSSDRKSPLAKRQTNKQTSIASFFGNIEAGGDGFEDASKSPEGEQGVLNNINPIGGGMESSGKQPDGFNNRADFSIPPTGGAKKKGAKKGSKKRANNLTPSLKTLESAPPK